MPPNRSERRPYPIRRYSGGILTFLAVTTALAAAPPQAARSQSESPRKHLAEYVAELQKDPSDDVLREKIIKLALTLQPKPAVPSEADELAGRAKYAIQHATSKADFVAAAEAFGKASLLAPWVPEYYFNQGVCLEKTERYADAIKDFEWYLMAAPDAKDAKEVRERIGGLKYASEKASQESAARQAEERARLEKAQQEAAARQQEDERNRRKQLALQAFKNMVAGRVYDVYTCFVPPLQRLSNGEVIRGTACNAEDYKEGRNWYRDPRSAGAFRFADDGRIMFCMGFGGSEVSCSIYQVEMTGTITLDQGTSDTVEAFRGFDAGVLWLDENGKRFWMNHNPSFSSFTVSINTSGRGAPARNDASDPNGRCPYTMYRAR